MGGRLHTLGLILGGIVVLWAQAPLPTYAGLITLSTDDGQGADAYIRGGIYDDLFFGSEPDLIVKSASPDYSRKSYLRLDLSTVSESAANAVLDLSIANVPGGGFNPDTDHVFRVYGLIDDHRSENWAENTLSWYRAPANVRDSGNDLTSDAVLLGTGVTPKTVSLGDIVSFSSSALTDFINLDTNDLVTFILTDDTGVTSPADFAARENTSYAPPTLRLTTSAVPEPSMAVLLSTAAAALFSYRWVRRRRVRAAGSRLAR